jgi:serine protease Do
VIGINSQIYSQSGGYQGVSFAIPIDVALNVKDQLMQHGAVTRGRLGVTIQDVNQALADSFGLKSPAGALVSAVDPNSPAGKAGIEAGDVIVNYNGKPINSSFELPAIVARSAPGTNAKLDVMRKGEIRHIDVTVGKLQDTKVASAGSGGGHDKGKLGVVVRPLNKNEQREAGVKGGVLVEEASGPAAQAGITSGDVILSVNGTPVTTVAQLQSLLAKAGKHIALLVQRNDAKQFVAVDLG